jgi:hypothetical protein
VVCRYAPVSGGVAVVAVSGVQLASSFFELRSRFVFVAALACGWVVLAPVAPVASQARLF